MPVHYADDAFQDGKFYFPALWTRNIHWEWQVGTQMQSHAFHNTTPPKEISI